MEKRENISGDMDTNNKASAFSVKIPVAKKYDTADSMFRSVNTVRELSPPISTEESGNTSEEVLSSNQSDPSDVEILSHFKCNDCIDYHLDEGQTNRCSIPK